MEPTIVDRSRRLPVDLSIVIVSWNVWQLLDSCLQSIERSSRSLAGDGSLCWAGSGQRIISGEADSAQSDSEVSGWPSVCLEVIVVDNASSDQTADLLPSYHPWVQLLTNTRNVGFPAGCNQGYAASRGCIVYFLNPDTELTEGSLRHLYWALATSPDVGVVGPRLCYPDGTMQSSRRRFPGMLTPFWESTWLAGWWPQNPWLRHYHLLDRPADRRQDVDWLVGAALMVRREVLEAVGAFDERFFMYSEELDLCRRVRQGGWRVVYVPEATVIHYEGRSSQQVVVERHIYFNTSKVRYHHTVYGALAAEFLRHFLLLEYRLQFVVEGLKLLLRHKPALRRARMAAYRRVLASHLR